MNEKFLEQIEKIVTLLGYECVHVGIRTDFGRLKVQVLIDSIGGINIDDCETVSKRINQFLDDEKNIFNAPELEFLSEGRYYLEVSSPGIERPLYKIDDYVRFQDREARIRLSKLLDGRKTFTGIIKDVDENSVSLFCADIDEPKIKKIPFEIIKGGNLVYRFENENDSDNAQKKKRKRRKSK